MSFNPVILTDTLCGQWESFLIHFWILLTWLCESLMASLLWQGSISWVPDGAMPLAQHSREKNALCKVTFKRLSSFSFNLPFCFPGAHTWARLLCLGPRGINEAWAGTLNQGRQWGLTVVSCHLPTFSLSGQFLVNRRPCSDSALTTTPLPPHPHWADWSWFSVELFFTSLLLTWFPTFLSILASYSWFSLATLKSTARCLPSFFHVQH